MNQQDWQKRVVDWVQNHPNEYRPLGRKYLGEHDLEDIVQDTVMDLIDIRVEKLATIPGWTIARLFVQSFLGKCKDRQRINIVRLATGNSEALLSSDRPYNRVDDMADTASLLMLLDESKRQVIVEHVFEHQTLISMAARRNISRPTMTRIYQSAIESLRRLACSTPASAEAH